MKTDQPPQKRGRIGRIFNRAIKPSRKHVEASRRSTPIWWVFLLLLIIGMYLVGKDTLGFSSLEQQYSSDLVNMAVSGPLYEAVPRFTGARGHDSISVALINEQTLQIRREHWPIAYRTHKLVLDALLSYCPRAVIVDFLFVDKRSDLTFTEFQNGIERDRDYGIKYCKSKRDIPIYFESNAQNKLRDDLVPLVGPTVDPTIVTHEGVARQYFLKLCDKESASCHDSLAEKVYADQCTGAPGKGFCPDKLPPLSDQPMDIWWGTAPDPINVRLSADESSYDSCNKSYSVLGRVWRAITDPSSLKSSCPYHSVIPVEALLNGAMENGKSDPDIPGLVRDRIVFYGADLNGAGDRSPTPVNGMLPNVFIHAMALDNLITLKGKTLHDIADRGWLTKNNVQILALIPVALLLAWLHVFQLRRQPSNQHRREGLAEYIRHVLAEFAVNLIAVALAVVAGVAASVFAQIAVATWVGIVFVAGELAGILALGLPDFLWGYVRHVIVEEESHKQHHAG